MDQPDPPGCEESLGRLQSLLDGESGLAERISTESHFAECPVCAIERAFELRLLAAIRGRLRAVRAPAGLRGRVMAALRQEPRIHHLM